MDLKTLKKLADACRKAGIKHFKNSEMEFTLTDEAPVSNYKKKIAEQSPLPQTPPPENEASLTEDQLLFYSVIDDETGLKE